MEGLGIRSRASTFTRTAHLHFCVPVDSASDTAKDPGTTFADSTLAPEPGLAFWTTGELIPRSDEEHQRCQGNHEHYYESVYQELISQCLLRVVPSNPREGCNNKTCSQEKSHVSRMGWVRTTCHCGGLTFEFRGAARLYRAASPGTQC